jgi:predicted nucleic acid-binding protein
MSGKYFLDTNILICTFDRENVKKCKTAGALVAEALAESRGVISYQVVQEFLNAAVRKFAEPLTPNDAQRYLTIVLEPLCAVFSSLELFHQALELSSRWGLPFYDALIVGAALQAECSILYSEDLQHGQQIGGLRIVNPFLAAA